MVVIHPKKVSEEFEESEERVDEKSGSEKSVLEKSDSDIEEVKNDLEKNLDNDSDKDSVITVIVKGGSFNQKGNASTIGKRFILL